MVSSLKLAACSYVMNKWDEQIFCTISHPKQKRKAQWNMSTVLKYTHKSGARMSP